MLGIVSCWSQNVGCPVIWYPVIWYLGVPECWVSCYLDGLADLDSPNDFAALVLLATDYVSLGNKLIYVEDGHKRSNCHNT